VKRIAITLMAVATVGVAGYIGNQLRADPPGGGQVQQANATAPATPTRTRVAMINLSQVLRNYEKWQGYEKQYKDYIEKLRVDFEAKKKPGLDLEASMAKLPADDKQREEIQKRLRDIKRELQDYEEAAKKNLTEWQDKALVAVYQEIHDAVEHYARGNDIEMVMHFNDAISKADLYHPMNVERKMKAPGCTPMYITPGMDITEIIVANLNARLHMAAPATGQQH
jgi:Skp family chaperone for outer membrane proteins